MNWTPLITNVLLIGGGIACALMGHVELAYLLIGAGVGGSVPAIPTPKKINELKNNVDVAKDLLDVVKAIENQSKKDKNDD